MKTFIGFVNVGDGLNLYSEAFEKKGHKMHKMLVGTNDFYVHTNADEYCFRPLKTNSKLKNFTRLCCFQLRMLYSFLCNILRCKQFIFFGYDSFLPFRIDYLFLKLFRKEVIIFFQGDDIRYRPIHNEIAVANGLSPLPLVDTGSMFSKWWLARLPELLGFKLISMNNQSTFAAKPYYFFRFPQPSVVDVPKRTNQIPVIVHAPSNRSIKGTNRVLEAIEEIREKGYEFEFRLLEKVSNDVVVNNLKVADILIDQPGSWCARLAVEACASSCCVIGGNKPEYEGVTIDSPIVQFPECSKELASVLETLLVDPILRQQKMDDCFGFWKDYYSYDVFSTWLNDIENGTADKVDPKVLKTFIVNKQDKGLLLKLLVWLDSKIAA